MMSRKEYMDWQNRQDRVSEYIVCQRAERFLEFLIVLQSKRSISYLQKVWGGGGIFVQAIPPPKKWGGGGCVPPSPRDLRQWTEVKLNLTFRNRI